MFKNALRLLVETLRWIIWDARILWLNFVVIASFFAISSVMNFSEFSVRFIGVLTQLIGAFTVLRGLSGTAKSFSQPNFGKLIRNWFDRRPRLQSRTVYATGGFVSTSGTLSASAYIIRGYEPGASIERRLDAIEANIKTAFEQMGLHTEEVNVRVDAISQRLDETNQIYSREVASINKLIQETQTSGLSISIIGVFWATAGIVLSGFPVEISNFIKSLS